MALRLGFKQEGLLKQHILDPLGEYIDLYQNAILAKEFHLNKTLAKLSIRIIGRNITENKEVSSINILSSNNKPAKFV